MILALRLRRSDAEHYWKVKELKIGLLTPYTGGNFGDAAIQEAVIGNIRKRLPEALIYHITLCPEKTSELHGIPSFPITPLAIRNYAPGRSTQVRRGDRTGTFVAGKCDILSWVKSTVKGFPLLFSFLKKGQELFASLNLMPRQIYYEIQYLVAAYRFMEGFSLLVVAGGGQLDDYWGGPMGHPYSLFRWAILTKLTGAKLIFLSVGTCSLDSRLSRFFVKHALKHAWYRSYRDHTSKKLLAAMPFTFGDPVLPDLAFSYDPKWIDATVPSTRRDNVIGISPIAYLSYHWPKQRESVYTHYIQQLATFCSNLVHEGYSIVIFVSDTRDVRAVNALVDGINRLGKINEGKISVPEINNVKKMLSAILSVRMVVASRLHGVILSHLMNIPTLAISYDIKVYTYMEDVQQSDYCIDIHDVTTNIIQDKFELLKASEEQIRYKTRTGISYMRAALESQYGKVLS